MSELPIDRAMAGIVGELGERSSLVIVAAPGAGKTTRVGPGILRGGILGKENGAIVMLQPRRVAARASAARIAFENGWRIGEEVGYQIRFEKRWGERTKLRVFTEAILTRMLLGDPYMEGVGCVILDEFHERNLHTDLALGFLREIQQTVRPELKIVVMSATLDAKPVADFLGGVPVVEVEGRLWPVEVAYRAGRDVRLEENVRRLVREALVGEGDVLVFLPGVGEIERMRRELGLMEGVLVLPLHGGLSSEEQQRALAADPAGRRKVILATNIAETSLTIDGVRAVVDSGLVRVASFDSDRGMDRLDLERISQASAVQRAGRAGRQGPGKAFRLWGELEQKHLREFNVPEVRRVDLSGALLAVHAWGAKDVRAFGWFERPSEEALAAAEGLLGMLGAIDDGGITERGRRMLSLPAHPRIARMLLAAAGTKWLAEAVNLAAILSDDSRQGVREDLVGMAGRVPAHLERVREQIWNVARGLPAEGDGFGVGRLEELLLLAYPDRVAKRRGADAFAAVMVGGVGLRLMEEALTPAVAANELFLALETHHDPRNKRAETMVKTAVPVEEAWLERLFPGQLRSETVMEFDQERQKVRAVSRHYFGDLVLSEDRHGKVDEQRAGEVLAEALSGRVREFFLADEAAARFLARVGLVRFYVPEVAWPRFDEAELRGILLEACRGKRSVAEVVEGGGLAEALRAAVVYPLDRELERLAPETVEVPSGSKIRLEYSLGTGDAIAGFLQNNSASPPPLAPVLAVRLQELFGWTDGPRVCRGRTSVLLHLLSPGFKPMQITSDLASFWRSAYFEVRKDLRVRYPKHKWPEDPLTAVAEAKGRGRRTT